MIYLPSCCSKPTKLLFIIFRTQIKIFVMKSDNFWSSIDSYATSYTLTLQKVHKEIIKLIHMN